MGVPRLRVCVVGAGVIGLSTAVHALQRNPHWDVTICAKPEVLPGLPLTSRVAAAFWYPYRVVVSGGGPGEQALAEPTLDRFLKLADTEGAPAGISLVQGEEYFGTGTLPTETKLPWWSGRRELHVARLKGTQLPGDSRLLGKFIDGFQFRLPVVHMPTYLEFLSRSVAGLVTPEPVVALDDLAGRYDLVFNCSGIGARPLLNDIAVRPLQGQVVWLRNVECPKLIFVHKGTLFENEPLYVVPRPGHDVVLGGTTVGVADGLADTFDPNDPAWLRPAGDVTDRILERCAVLCPSLKEAGTNHRGHAWVGLRPCREPLRLEGVAANDPGGHDVPVVHNYGHGGAGVTLSWGTAIRAVKLGEDLVA